MGGIVDCHTHVGLANVHVGGQILDDLMRVWGRPLWNVPLEQHLNAMEGVDKAIVLAFDAPDIGVHVPNEYVAAYVREHPEKLIGFASVDPKRKHAPEILDDAVTRLGLRGLKIAPIYQHFDPLSSECYALLEAANTLRIPVLWHQGTTFVRDAPLLNARPVLIDEIARRFPDLRMWVAHLGHPWCEELIVVVRKHPNVYTDMSALETRPLQMYFAMMAAVEYRVTDKIFFGTDYPFSNLEASLAGMRQINDIVQGTGLPRISEEVIEGIIVRNPLTLIGLA